jgi:hypothetical protein
MSHRRSYLPDGRMNHYEELRLRQHAEKYHRIQTGRMVHYIHQAKTLRSGTTSYEQAMEAVRQIAKARGFFRGTWLRLEIAFVRMWGWITNRHASYRPKAA